MSPETFSVQLWNLLLRFRKTVWFRVTYLVLLGIIVSFLLVFTAGGLGCLVIIVAPLAVFLVPYYLGERSLKRFALNALPVILIAILLGGALQTSALYSQRIPIESAPGPFMSPTMALSNGTVIPVQSDSPRAFTFRVKLTSTVNATPDMFAVALNLTTVTGLNDYPMSAHPMINITVPGSFNNTRLGTWFETSVNLSTSIYAYGFSVWDKDSNWTFTNVDIGPLTAPVTSYYGLFSYFTIFSMILPFLFYFIILFMWWYTVRQRATRTRMLGAEPQIPKEKPKPKVESVEPTKSEKASKAAAFTCTNCGADVDESAEKCPKCGAVFEE
ncbi:MAG: zinc ribbon domain-containing protein [Methanobacteriota archaeon]|nr:MAG: zinc ribbon domain-containing protein [Euryarchaeota archaeon]